MGRKICIGCVLVAGCLLVSVVTINFMERHWDHVARRLAEAVARDIGAVVDLYEAGFAKDDVSQLTDIGLNRFGLALAVLPAGPLPVPQAKPFFDLLDRALSDEIRANIKRPFWIDTVGQSRQVEVRIKLDQANLRFVAPRAYVYASNSHIFLLWMVDSWAVLLTAGYFLLRPARKASQ
jgi:two-component system, OmpR family, osmolarity sensor histidine kinase EnvZ